MLKSTLANINYGVLVIIRGRPVLEFFSYQDLLVNS